MDPHRRALEVLRVNDGVLSFRRHARATINTLLAAESIVRVHPGVFVDAELLTSRLTRYAAALEARPASVLWGESAVAAITADQSPFGPREKIRIAQAEAGRPPSGVSIHRRRITTIRRFNGLRCPSAAYLALEASGRDGGKLIQRFLRERLMTPADLTATLPAFTASPGQDARRRIVRVHLDNPWSGGEKELQDLLRKHRVRGWVANHELEIAGRTYYPDLYIEDVPLVVEFDGYGVHSQPDVFETDRIRQNALVRAGITVLRYTWKRLQGDPDAVVAEIKAAIAGEMARDPRRPPG